MKCPHCPDVTLLMAERQGIEIDYCPQCRGIWLDRGELDRLLEIAAGSAVPPMASKHQPYTARSGHRQDFDDSDRPSRRIARVASPQKVMVERYLRLTPALTFEAP